RSPYCGRSRIVRSEARMMSRTRRIAASDDGLMFANQRSTPGDFGTTAMLRSARGFTSAGQRQWRRVSAALACVTGTERIENAYERRIRIASEVATWGIAGVLVASAALPTTDSLSRLGLLLSAAF